MGEWGAPALPDEVVCPIPRAISHDDARATFAKVRKEMPGLTEAAWRREAARRMDTDYDTYLKAWKKPPKVEPVMPPSIVRPDLIPGPRVIADKLSKKTVPATDISHYSSTYKSTSKTATEIRIGDKVIGKIQKAAQGFYETGPTNVRTGRWIVERRGYVSIDTKGNVIKEGFSPLHHSADDAIALLKKRAHSNIDLDTPLPPTVTVPAPRIAPRPQPVPTLTYDTARAQHKLVKKEFPTYTDAQARREAAKRMNVDYDTYLRAWKTKPTTKPGVPVQPTVRPSPTLPVKPTKSAVPVRKPGGLFRTKAEARTNLGSTKKPLRKETDLQFGHSRPFHRYKDEHGEEFGSAFERGPMGVSVQIKGLRGGSKTFKDMKAAEKFIKSIWDNGLPDHLAVNPEWGRLAGTTMNCPSTSVAYELRRRGYDVIARTMPNGKPIHQIYRAFGVKFDNMIGGFGTDWVRWELNLSRDLPDGARGFISVIWTRGGGHIFNWEKRDGKIWYIDAQSGKEWGDGYPYVHKTSGGVNIARVDDIPDNEDMRWLATDSGKQEKTEFDPPWIRRGEKY